MNFVSTMRVSFGFFSAQSISEGQEETAFLRKKSASTFSTALSSFGKHFPDLTPAIIGFWVCYICVNIFIFYRYTYYTFLLWLFFIISGTRWRKCHEINKTTNRCFNFCLFLLSPHICPDVYLLSIFLRVTEEISHWHVTRGISISHHYTRYACWICISCNFRLSLFFLCLLVATPIPELLPLTNVFPFNMLFPFVRFFSLLFFSPPILLLITFLLGFCFILVWSSNWIFFESSSFVMIWAFVLTF